MPGVQDILLCKTTVPQCLHGNLQLFNPVKTDPKSKAPACLSRVLLARSLLPHNKWSQANPAAFAGGHLTTPIAIPPSRSNAMWQCAAAVPGQRSLTGEMNSGRAERHNHHRDRAPQPTPRRAFMGRKRGSSAATVLVLWSARGR